VARNWYDSIVPADAAAPRDIDVTVAHPARVYDYWLGGKDNFAVDRQAAEEVLKAKPGIRLNVRANRGFLARTVRYLAGEAGISQFLDIGTGIPTANNTHEVAQAVRPDARVVYVDNDPIVLTHARALLTSTQGTTSFIEADLRDTGLILSAAAKTLDFSKPVAIMMIAVPGSYLAISHPASDVDSRDAERAAQSYNQHVAAPMRRRSREEFGRFFDGLEMIEPGIVQMHQWRPAETDLTAPSSGHAAVARKP